MGSAWTLLEAEMGKMLPMKNRQQKSDDDFSDQFLSSIAEFKKQTDQLVKKTMQKMLPLHQSVTEEEVWDELFRVMKELRNNE